MSDYTVLDVLAEPAQVIGARVRLAIAEAIQDAATANGTVSAATLRPLLLERGISRDLMEKRMPAMLGAAVHKEALEWTGRYVPSGNTASRNDQRAVKEYRPTTPTALADWVDAYDYAFNREVALTNAVRNEVVA